MQGLIEIGMPSLELTGGLILCQWRRVGGAHQISLISFFKSGHSPLYE